MLGLSTWFGYYPEPLCLKTESILIQSLPYHDASVGSIDSAHIRSGDWIYCTKCRREGGEYKIRSKRVFSLPKTHFITHYNSDDANHLEFLIWRLSFFLGVRLTSSEAGFLDATPIKPGSLNDFEIDRPSLEQAIAQSERFWLNHASDTRSSKRICGIIHCLFLAQNTEFLQFERFIYLYMPLDGCFASLKSDGKAPKELKTHARQVSWMCEFFGIPIPKWAAVDSDSKSEVSRVRNDAIHEALFFEEPLGFALYGGSSAFLYYQAVPLEMEALVCRLLVAILSIDCPEYVKTPVGTRSILVLKVSPP